MGETPKHRDGHGQRSVPAQRAWAAYGIGPVFFALAAWFLWGPAIVELPTESTPKVNAAQLTTAPRRDILGNPPTIEIGGFKRTCMDCHQMFPPRDDPPVALAQHKHIVLNHGINKQCRNCHNPKDRNLLVLRGGETITYDQVETLCAKCHGPTYRDWENGAHGRTNGFWDASRGTVRRLRCTECHDPHNPRVPAMDPLAPLPGPHTLRMGNVHADDESESPHTEHRDPLRRAIHKYIADERKRAESVPAESVEVEYYEGEDSQ